MKKSNSSSNVVYVKLFWFREPFISLISTTCVINLIGLYLDDNELADGKYIRSQLVIKSCLDEINMWRHSKEVPADVYDFSY